MKETGNNVNVRELFTEYLKGNHKRCTAERYAVLDIVLKIPGHFTADSVSDRLQDEGFPVSCATVYSTLGLLVDFGLLVKQHFANQASLYEKSSSFSSPAHLHLICTACGKIKEVRDPVFSRQIEEKRFPSFSQNYYTLNVYGVCGSCSRKKKKVLIKKNNIVK